MKITIFNPAPLGETLTRWGDYPFGRALQRSLEALGAQVTQRYWPQWTQETESDVHLVLRGKRVFPEPHRRPAILWMVSHPSSVGAAELAAYDVVLLGSRRHLSLLGENAKSGEFEVARQCTEFDRAEAPAAPAAAQRSGVIFVANSRGIRRPILRWALELGVPVELYGRQWENFRLANLVRAEYVENEKLPSLYRDSRLALNDHWTDMRYFGYINNRLFDCLASGLPVFTDDFAELHEVFGDCLLYAADRASFLTSWRRFLGGYEALHESVSAWWQRMGGEYTFDARARLIADVAERISRAAIPRAPAAPPAAGNQELEGLLAGSGNARVLHIAPESRLAPASDLMSRIDYITAGPGCGPWTVEIDGGLTELARGSFGAVIVDDITGWELADAFDPEEFLNAALGLLKPQGFLLVHANSSLVRAGRGGWNPDTLERASENYYRRSGEDAPAPPEADLDELPA